jgi:serine/threonine protein kinase
MGAVFRTISKVPAPPHDRFDKYEVIRRLGRGGMGTVYLARDPALDRLVAIKVLRDALLDDELLERFMREARAAANLRHENLITIYEVGQQDNQPFMAMEYVDGESLDKVIAAKQPLTLTQRLDYAEQICAGLYHAHCAGIVHRDVKPANIMIDRHRVVRLLDFGIAHVEGSAMTGDGAMIGTLPYMSWEQMAGKPVDYRSDIFAVGAVAYELLTYQRAFNRSFDNASAFVQEDPVPLAQLCPTLPAALPPIVMRAMARQPEDRFDSLDQMRLALRQVRRSADPSLDLEPEATRVLIRSTHQSQTPAPSSPQHEILEQRAPQHSHRSIILASIGVAAAIIVTAVVWMFSGREAPSSAQPRVATGVPSATTLPNVPSTAAASPPATTSTATVPLVDSTGILQDQLDRITASYRRGDLDAALVLIRPVLAGTNDSRVVELANAIAQSARRSMAAAATAAINRNAGQLAAGTVALAAQSRTLAESAFNRKDFVEAGTQALLAAAIYNRAEREAVAGTPATPPAPVASAPVPSPVASAPANPVPVASPPPAASAPAASAATVTPPSPPVPAPSPLDRERAGILQALTRYQSAYRERSIQALVAIYPSIPRETRQRLERTFTRDCRDYDVTFGNMQPALNDDPTYATVTVRTTYSCQPKGAQAAQQASVQELFVLRKLGDAWLIESAGTMDAPRPR